MGPPFYWEDCRKELLFEDKSLPSPEAKHWVCPLTPVEKLSSIITAGWELTSAILAFRFVSAECGGTFFPAMPRIQVDFLIPPPRPKVGRAEPDVRQL